MSEAKITVDNHTHLLPQPFMVIATQNPIEHHGTYPLPESQLDRFLMRISMGYPSESHEKEILRSSGQQDTLDLDPVISTEDLLRGQEEVQYVRFEETLLQYLMALVRATRECELLALGVSTRGAMFLYRASQALAYFQGRSYCTPDDVKRLAVPVFSHRVLVSPRHASPLEKTRESESIIEDLVDQVEVPV